MNLFEAKCKETKEILLRAASFITCCALLFPINVWALACSDIFSNGIQATSATGNINLSFHSRITGGSATLKTVTLTDSSAWAACSGSTCAPSGSPAPTSTPTFLPSTGVDGVINIAESGSGNFASGNYGAATIAQFGILKFNDNGGVYKTGSFTTGLKSEVWLRAGDYWINGNLTLGQETILRRISPSGSTRIFVNGNVSIGFRASTSSFNSSQLLIYATGTITSANEVNLSAFIYGGGNVSFGFQSVINGAVSGNNFTASGNEVTVNYQPSSFASANFSPFCSGVAATVDHYELQVASRGLACVGVDVTVRACPTSASPCTAAGTISGNVTLAASAGTLNATTLTLVSGTATTKLKNASAADGSTTTVTLSGETTSALNARKCCNSSGCSVANSCAIIFNTAGFLFSNNATTVGDIPTEVAGVTDNLIYLRAIQSNTSTGACSARFTSAQDVLLAYQCRNPATCIAGQTLRLNGSAIQSNASAAGAISYSTVSLNFNSQGTIAIPLNYSDVGQIRLFASLTRAATANDPAFTLLGTSNDFVVKPYTLVASALTSSGGVNPGGTTLAGTAAGFVAAGTPFQVKVEARKFPGTASADITPNFGNEATSESDITLTAASLIYPAGGTLSPLTGTTGFASGTPAGTWVNSGVIWDQVGSITIQPRLTDNDYVGTGDIGVLPPSGTIGRFYPDHYSLIISGSIINSCASSLIYMDQPASSWGYRIEARGTTETVLSNYGGNYAGLVIARPYPVAENANNGTNLITRLSNINTAATATSWINGLWQPATVIAKFDRAALPDGPYTSLQLGVGVTDTFDARSLLGTNMNASNSVSPCIGAGCKEVSLGAPWDVRYGRLRLDDAFGPETVLLPVNLVTEYWTGNNFILNASDSCTAIPRAAITYPNGTLMIDANRSVSLSSGSTLGVYNNIDATGININAGTAGHFFSKPDTGGTGSFTVGINLTDLPWLRYDWNQDGNYSDTTIPNARFSFGSYRGNDRVIYWREKLQ
ncbi:MAG: DUF6701 domain-containing protein [Pseudomonadota bacterium]